MGEPASAALREAAWGDYVRRCASRDESALAALYDESSQLTYTIAKRILQDEADGSEVVLDVYKQVWDAAARFDERRGSAAAWIVVLARSRAMDRRRSRAARMRTAVKVEELHDVISRQPSPESLAIASQSSRIVMHALSGGPFRTAPGSGVSFLWGIEPFGNRRQVGRAVGDGENANPPGSRQASRIVERRCTIMRGGPNAKMRRWGSRITLCPRTSG